MLKPIQEINLPASIREQLMHKILNDNYGFTTTEALSTEQHRAILDRKNLKYDFKIKDSSGDYMKNGTD